MHYAHSQVLNYGPKKKLQMLLVMDENKYDLISLEG
jgi:hypothetical protein